MEALDFRVIELILSAEDMSKEGATVADRSDLFIKLVGVFLSKNAPEKTIHRKKLLSAVSKLLPAVDEATRDQTVARLSNMTNPPVDLVCHIVLDDAERVAPLLRTVDFEEDDLIDIIEKTGRGHHHELAVRDDLSANVWIALARAAPEPDAADQKPLRGDLEPLIPAETVTRIRPTPGELRLVQSDAPKAVINRKSGEAANLQSTIKKTEEPMSLDSYRTSEAEAGESARQEAIKQTMSLLQAATERLTNYDGNDVKAIALESDIIATCTKTLAELTEAE